MRHAMRCAGRLFTNVGILVLAATFFGEALAAPPAEEDVSTGASATAEAVEPFWAKGRAKLSFRSLSPVSVKLAALPDDSKPRATFPYSRSSAPADYVPTNPVLRPYLTREKAAWRLVPQGLAEGATPYADRKYVIDELPEAFHGLPLLQTRMGQKTIVDARFYAVLQTDKPTYVFLAIDTRLIDLYRRFGPPLWMNDFTPTVHHIRTDDPIMAAAGGYRVYVKRVPAGRFILGPACGEPERTTMYFAFFAAAE